MHFTLMTDSCCDLPYEFLVKNNVQYVSMMIHLEDKEYIDDLGEEFNTQWFMSEIKNGKMPSTSQINVGTYLEIFEPFVNSEEPLLYLAFSSGLSGSYNNAITAVSMLKEKYIHVPITVIDTKAASLGEGLLVHEVIKLRDKNYTLDDTLQWLKDNKMNVHSWVTVNDLNHLERGGRISKTSATVGNFMNIKPIIAVDAQGKLVKKGKVRGRKKALEKLVENTYAGMLAEAQTIFIAYAGDRVAAENVQKMFELKTNVHESIILPMGPTIASHTGYGAIAVFSMGVSRKKE